MGNGDIFERQRLSKDMKVTITPYFREACVKVLQIQEQVMDDFIFQVRLIYLSCPSDGLPFATNATFIMPQFR
jgi:hypothetical protein